MLIPRIMNWDWKCKYFGAPALYIASLALMGWVPLFSIVLYGKFPLWISLGYFGLNISLTYWWCRRFVHILRRIYDDPELRRILYVEEQDAVYFMRSGDARLFEERFKFKQLPTSYFFVVPIALAFCILPFIRPISEAVGVPFTQILLAIACIPVNLFALGFATKGFLVYYYYPWKIKRQTGKDVYVDMASPSPNRKTPSKKDFPALPQVGEIYISSHDPNLTVYVDEVTTIEGEDGEPEDYCVRTCNPAHKEYEVAQGCEFMTKEWTEHGFIHVTK
jgi:hypothetical protein